MRAQAATDAGSPNTPSEDQATIGSNILVIVDGATVRTSTGCIHGAAWYAANLADAIVTNGEKRPTRALANAITHVTDLHRDTCDVNHPGTPSAAVGIVAVEADTLHYLVLGDVTLIFDVGGSETVVTDDRVSNTAQAERAAADALPAGSAEKAAALIRMKHVELAARNTTGGYWIAASDPRAVDHALAGSLPVDSVGRLLMLTDGAARAVDPFRAYRWRELLDLAASDGPAAIIERVRAVEHADPAGERWPRNKLSDDATAIYCDSLTA